MHSCIHAFIHHSSFIIHHSSFIIHHSSSSSSSLFNYILSLLAIIGIITKASVSSLESSCFSKYSGAPQGHHMIFHAKGPPCPLPHIYIIVIYHISLLHPRWDEQCRDTMMTVPPQLTSSLPSFSYPASFRHPPPASSSFVGCFYLGYGRVQVTEPFPFLDCYLRLCPSLCNSVSRLLVCMVPFTLFLFSPLLLGCRVPRPWPRTGQGSWLCFPLFLFALFTLLP